MIFSKTRRQQASAFAACVLILFTGKSVGAQTPNLQTTFDASSNLTVVRLTLPVSRNFDLRLNKRFSGREPSDGSGWYGFAFGTNTETGSHELALSIDDRLLTLKFPEYSSFQLPRALLLQIEAGRTVQGKWDGESFTVTPDQQKGIHQFLDAVSPKNLTELDQPRVERWDVARTVDYLNQLLSAGQGANCARNRLAIEDKEIHVYTQRCSETFEAHDMLAAVGNIQRRALLYLNGAVSLDCVARETCARTRNRDSVGSPWTAGDGWTWVRLDLGEGRGVEGEKIKNALEYLVGMLRE